MSIEQTPHFESLADPRAIADLGAIVCKVYDDTAEGLPMDAWRTTCDPDGLWAELRFAKHAITVCGLPAGEDPGSWQIEYKHRAPEGCVEVDAVGGKHAENVVRVTIDPLRDSARVETFLQALTGRGEVIPNSTFKYSRRPLDEENCQGLTSVFTGLHENRHVNGRPRILRPLAWLGLLN
ncbi:MAG TPA: hypothetical protein VKQ34_03555 [Candidatus Saccharimonadales bacterium]|nr:hypothetical protein [Candidatus Saccharimonadales bacterium]